MASIRLVSTFEQRNSSDCTPIYPDFSSSRRDDGANGDGSSASDPRLFTYMVVGATGVFSAMAAKGTVLDFLTTLAPSAATMATAQTEVDLSSIPEGKNVVIKWRGKPIFIRHRTPSEIDEANSVDLSELRDPQPDSDRVQKPEWLVMLGVCTHLGCVPNANAGEYNGWYCPCQ